MPHIKMNTGTAIYCVKRAAGIATGLRLEEVAVFIRELSDAIDKLRLQSQAEKDPAKREALLDAYNQLLDITYPKVPV